MDIEAPELDTSGAKPTLKMFCPEERYPREIYWAGFGFQVWCQLLTFIVQNKDISLLIIDEPDIYLHSDLQRQLVGLLKSIGHDVLLATHSTEIVSEADPGDLVVVNKKGQSAKRITNPSQLQDIFSILGSNLNPTLTQLAKTRRALFVEGKDFQILSAFARRLKKNAVANRSDFAVIPVHGFNPKKVGALAEGIEMTLGTPILKAVIFDRDYRSEQEVAEIKNELDKFACLSHIHIRKEIENYLIVPDALQRAIAQRVKDFSERSGLTSGLVEDVASLMETITEPMRIVVRP